MQKNKSRLWKLALWSLLFFWGSEALQALTLNEYKQQSAGRVLLLRHALAPGFGDPSNFQLRDCQTQRNLDEVGREQARRIGRTFREAGVQFAGVYSSQWCRCLETARLLDVGEVQELPALNSFFQGLVPREKTLAELRAFLQQLPETGLPILLVTHQVTISAITGYGVGSGSVVAYNPASGEATRIELPTD